MLELWPHEYLRLDFDQILIEAQQQESKHPANAGELAFATNLYRYFTDTVIPLILTDDWVFEAVTWFAQEYFPQVVPESRTSGKQTFEIQNRKEDLDADVTDFLAKAIIQGWADDAQDLVKASDFGKLLHWNKLSKSRYRQEHSKYLELEKQVKALEVDQLWITYQGMRDAYETSLPRIMYVLRRVIKRTLGLSAKNSDTKLLGISDSESFYQQHIIDGYPLYPILGKDALAFYKIVRNAASHHDGYTWDAARDQIVLKDREKQLVVHVHDFQQKYRFLVVYLCDYGTRALLAGFCERDQGKVSNGVLDQYISIFPEGWNRYKEIGNVKRYSVE